VGVGRGAGTPLPGAQGRAFRSKLLREVLLADPGARMKHS